MAVERWLNGWKEIALYLGVSIWTVKAWHRKRPGPVYRAVPGGTVQAKPSELDAWVKNEA
jgi:hypothetical protein